MITDVITKLGFRENFSALENEEVGILPIHAH